MNKYIFEKDYYDRLYGFYYIAGETADIISGEVRKNGYYIFPVESEAFNEYGSELTENKVFRIYQGGSLFDSKEQEWRTKEYNKLIQLEGVDVFSPIKQPFNDKANCKPTPNDIYMGDTVAILQSDIVLVDADDIEKGDGGMSYEAGLVAGVNIILDYLKDNHNDVFEKVKKDIPRKTTYSVYSDCRKDSFETKIPNAHGVNHYVYGGLETTGGIYENFNELYDKLKKDLNDK